MLEKTVRAFSIELPIKGKYLRRTTSGSDAGVVLVTLVSWSTTMHEGAVLVTDLVAESLAVESEGERLSGWCECNG